MKKAIIATWLFKTDLSNLNAGEGSTNLKEIKTYKNGLPYISGQSVRHALRKAIQRENPDAYKCTVEYPCGDIKDCWLCDVFGYMLPSKGIKRWSPLKVSPALGQIKTSITTDLILRLVNEIECPKCHKNIYPLTKSDKDEEKKEKKYAVGQTMTCPECKEKFNAPYDIRQALAYKQLISNLYRVSISIDVNALGVEEVPETKGEGKESKIVGIKYNKKYDENKEKAERKKRVEAVLNAISNISDFASLSREMTNTNPDVILLSYQNNYNNRLASSLEMDETGNINEERFKAIIEDCLSIEGAKLFAGFIPGTFNNQNEIENILKKNPQITFSQNPREVVQSLIKEIKGE